jgi:hypothetical protein
MRFVAVSLGVLLLAGCSSSSPSGTGSALTADASTVSGEQWLTLITGDWAMPPGKEGYYCARQTLDHDVLVRGFDAINPKGTHHTLLTIGDPDAPDGVTKCNAAVNRTRSVFGSGVGTDPLRFPEGIGFRIKAGTQLLLNLHLFNTGDADLTGTSGTRALVMKEADLVHEAEGLLAGTTNITVNPGETATTIGHCTMTQDETLFAVAPHMHQLGIHEKVVVETAAKGDVVIHDAAYSFDEQSYRLIAPLVLNKGDKVRVECTHQNTTGKVVHFGDSSLAEMCFAGLYRYPAAGGSFICADGQTGSGLTLGGPPCAAVGDPGNTLGIGKQCTKGAAQCGQGAICLADFVAGTWGNFCTILCSADADCGAGAVCSPARPGSSSQTCIPQACVGTAVVPDAGP